MLKMDSRTLFYTFCIFVVILSYAYSRQIVFKNNLTFTKPVVSPTEPSDSDTIKLIMYMKNKRPYSGYFNNTFKILDSKIKISAKYISAFAYPHPTDKKIEALTIGKLTAKTYTVELIREETTIHTTVEPPHNMETHSLDSTSTSFYVKPTLVK